MDSSILSDWMSPFELRHDKTSKMSVPSKDSDQLGHLPSLIRVFAVRMKKAWVLSTYWAHSEDSDQTGCPGWSESSLGAQSFCWFCHLAAHLSFKGCLVFYSGIKHDFLCINICWDPLASVKSDALSDCYSGGPGVDPRIWHHLS